MGVESDIFPETDLFTCPFMAQCDLPNHHFICNISGFKTYSEYIARYNKLKHHRVFITDK